MGFEPTTFCMASRRSSQLSYSRTVERDSAPFAPDWLAAQPDVKESRPRSRDRAGRERSPPRASFGQAFLVVAVAVLVAAPAAAAAADTARYILPPGNFGGLPTTKNSLDQLPLYDALTPAARERRHGGHQRYFLPENFEPIGATHEEQTGRPGLRLVYDDYGIPHVYGQTREDLAFGAGWTTARDRGLLIPLGRGPARVAVADVPGINAFGLVTSASRSSRARRPRRWSPRRRSCSSTPTATRAARSSPTPRPTPTASTPTGRRTTSTRRPQPSTTCSP